MKTVTFYSGKLWYSDKPFPVREHFHSLSFEDNQKLYLNHIKENWLSTAYEVVNPEVIPTVSIAAVGFLTGDGSGWVKLSDGDQITLPEGYTLHIGRDQAGKATIDPPEKPENSAHTHQDYAGDRIPLITTVEPSESQEEIQDEQWMDVCVETHAIEKIGVSAVVRKLKEKFTITRK